MAFFEIKQKRIKQKRNKSGSVCSGRIGPPCYRCKRPTEVWQHETEPTHYPHYTRWYKCINSKCKTTLIMPDKFKVVGLDVHEELTPDEVRRLALAHKGPPPF